ncbi:MAG: barstar family protein [Luteimonas sp.]
MTPGDGLQLRAMLADPALCGVYTVTPGADDEAIAAARALDFAAVAIDFDGCRGKDEAIARIAAALRFPAWFGGNWDALADALADLSWLPAPGYVLRLAHAEAWREADPAAFDMLASILEEAAARWARERIPFWALLPTPDPQRP